MEKVKNQSTRFYVTIQGVLGGLAGMIHGFAEISQGNRPTGGQWLVSVGAFTLIPNYLVTGIAAVLVGLCVLVWTLGFISIIFQVLTIVSGFARDILRRDGEAV